jgi:hypothetical protein
MRAMGTNDMRLRWRLLAPLAAAGVLVGGGCSGSGSSGVGDELGAQGKDAAVADGAAEEEDAGGGEPGLDAGSSGTDAAADEPDAGAANDAGDDAGSCDLGTAQNGATAENLPLFGEITWFADGVSLPEGRYRVHYLDGCMKYGSGQDWTVNAYANGSIAWWVVDDASANLVIAPGTVGYSVATGAYAEFEACVAANLEMDAPVEFDHAGGRIGIAVRDSPVYDNMAGVDGRNPSYRLEAVDGCLPLPTEK